MKNIGINFILMIITSIALILGLNASMKFLTHHHQKLEVPDIKGLLLNKGIDILSDKKMGYILVDSLFDPNLQPHEIIDQSPKKGAFVKQNRKIYITINSVSPPSVTLPSLVDMSKRQAKLILESSGLKMGREIYQPDIAKDAVLAFRVNGKTITSDITLPKGSIVDLVLGDGLSSLDVEIPDLIGLTVMEAMAVLDAMQLSVGQISAQGSVKDQMSAYIYYQQPEYGSAVKVAPGDPVNLYVTNSIPENLMK
ncbi:MAG TPA: PASTA domain-containing protein [Chitinophagales bacterium]|nr:PASTA domain-containing protein [Chitinophagales bacterium]